MATLKSHHKRFIVKKLACFDRPSEVVELVKEEFGIEVTRQQVSYYNPERTKGRAGEGGINFYQQINQKITEKISLFLLDEAPIGRHEKFFIRRVTDAPRKMHIQCK